ncbi:MAG: serine hydrolase [Saprospiraceae bacterium]
MKHILFTALFGWLTYVSVKAQIPNQQIMDYQQALAELVVLHNKQSILPLQGLDTLRPVLLTLGLSNDSELYQTLNTYLPVGNIHWNKQGEAEVTWPFPHQEPPNLLILAISGEDALSVDFNWSALLANSQVVGILFGKNSFTDVITDGAFDALLYSETDSPWSQSLAAQLIFGAINGEQKLRQPLNSHLQAGHGVQLSNCQRLAFAPAAQVGMDHLLLQDSIKAIVQEGLANGAYPGAQVLVARNGVVVYHETFGYHTDTRTLPVQRSDLYDLASITKITSALPVLMKWYGEGEFNLDAPLSAYYPAAKGTNKAALPFRLMLSHQAQLRPWIPYWQMTLKGHGKYPWRKRWNPERINDYRFRAHTLSRQSADGYDLYLTDSLWQYAGFRKKMMKAILQSPLSGVDEYRYSGLLFYLLPDIITAQTTEDYESFLNSRFYRPLGAYTLGFNPMRYYPKSRIVPTERDTFFRKQLLHGYVHDEGAAMMGGVSANAGLFANAYDLAKIMQLYMNGGTYGGQRYIHQIAIDTFTARHYTERGNYRGLGFDKPLLTYDPLTSSVAQAASDRSFGHSGYTGTFTWADPENGLLFVFLSNRVYPTRNNRALYTNNIRPRIHTVLYKSVGHAP